MHATVLVRWLATAGAATLLLTGCSLGDNDAAKNDAEPVSIASILGTSDYRNVDSQAQKDSFEDAVAKCMIAEGWEYIPFRYPEEAPPLFPSDEEEIARIKREGLGIAYSYLFPGDTSDPSGGIANPNDAYVDSLSDEGRLAYYASLQGTPEELATVTSTYVDPETGTRTTGTSTGSFGCQGEAGAGLWGDGVATSPELWEALQAYYSDLDQRVDSDRRMLKLNEDWSACMRKSGFDYTTQLDSWTRGVDEFLRRSDEIVGGGSYKDPMDGWSQNKKDEFWASATEEEIDALRDRPLELTTEQRSKLEAVLADEVTLALAEHACTGDLNAKAQDISADVEAAYALEHEAELTALAATRDGLGG